jgi:hypothetical protein
MDGGKGSMLLVISLLVTTPSALEESAGLTTDDLHMSSTEVLASLRAAVAPHLGATEDDRSDLRRRWGVEHQLAQWYNFPNFANCFRPPWRNC